MFEVDLDLMWVTGGLCGAVRSMYALCLVTGSEGNDTREKGARLFDRFSEIWGVGRWPPNCIGKSLLLSEVALLWSKLLGSEPHPMCWSCARTRGRSSGPVSLTFEGDLDRGGVEAAVIIDAGDQSLW